MTLDIRSAQRLVWDNKTAKGFNTLDVPLEFCLLQGEAAEAFQAWRRKRAALGEELADVVLYALSLAQMNGIDLESEVERKIAVNAARVYRRDPRSGVLVRAAERERR